MNKAALVLKDFNLFAILTQFQNGLPFELMEITHLARGIAVSRSNTNITSWSAQYLSNIPSRFINTPYLQEFDDNNELPSYVLFFSGLNWKHTLPLHLSILENNIKHVEMWIKYKPEWLTPAPLNLAAICGHREIVKKLVIASKEVCTAQAMDLAAINGHIDVVKWLHNLQDGPGCTTAAMDGAANFGHLEVVQFLNENRSEGCTTRALAGAVCRGYAKVVDYLLLHRQERYSIPLLIASDYYHIKRHRAADDKDYLGVIRILSHHGLCISEQFIMTALKTDPLPIVQFIHQNNIFGITMNVFETLIQIGDENAIRYALEAVLNENNKPISLLDCDNTVNEPWIPLDNAKFLSGSHRFPKEWQYCTAMDVAASVGDLDTVKMLHRTGIKCCTVGAMNNASALQRFDILEWLHIHRNEGCSNDAMTYAIAGGNFEIVQWLHRVCGLKCTVRGLSTAAHNGDIGMVKYLLSIPMENEEPSIGDISFNMPKSTTTISVFGGNAVDRAASNGHINVVEILFNYPASTDAMDYASLNGHLEMIEYLHTHRKEGCTTNALINAVATKRLDILKYLVTQNCCHTGINNENVCVEAAGINNIEMLTFCMDYLHVQFTPKFKQVMMYKAALYDQIENLQWLHEVHGFGWTNTILNAAEIRGYKKVVQYLQTIGNCDDDVLDRGMLVFL